MCRFLEHPKAYSVWMQSLRSSMLNGGFSWQPHETLLFMHKKDTISDVFLLNNFTKLHYIYANSLSAQMTFSDSVFFQYNLTVIYTVYNMNVSTRKSHWLYILNGNGDIDKEDLAEVTLQVIIMIEQTHSSTAVALINQMLAVTKKHTECG